MNLNDIKKVREKTLAPITKVKEALAAVGDDVAKAIQWLAENWKPKEKDAGFGKVFVYSHFGRIGAMLELACGTDFVARTDEFVLLGEALCQQVIAGLDGKLEDQVYIKDPEKKVKDLIDEVSKKTGETVKVRRYERWTV